MRLAARGPSVQSRANPHLFWGKSEGVDRDGYMEEERASLRSGQVGGRAKRLLTQGPESEK